MRRTGDGSGRGEGPGTGSEEQLLRALTILVTPPEAMYARGMFDDSAVVRERVYHANVLDDGSVVLLGRIRGDLDRARRLVEEEPAVIDYSISGKQDGSGLAYVHSRPPAEVTRFLQLPRRHEVFFEFPVEITSDGRLRVVVIGETNAVLQRALADVPPGFDVEVKRIGAYLGDSGSLASLLTDRQREVLEVAVELGYYDVPRRASHRDVAERLDISAGTVSEHLQKLEARVLRTLVD